MARKNGGEERLIIQKVNAVISCVTDKRNKTWADLQQIAYQWCAKDYAHSEREAESWGVEPVYLVLASLLYVEHPLLVGDARSWKYSMTYSIALILQVEIDRIDVGIPIVSTNSINMGVETMPATVETIEI